MRRVALALVLALLVAPALTGCRIIGGTIAFAGLLTDKVVGSTVVATSKVLTAPARFVRDRSRAREARQARYRFEERVHVAEHRESVEVIWLAAHDALKRMRFVDVRGDHDATGGGLEATSRQGQPIRVALRARAEGGTELRIAVGVEGDAELSRLIHRRIVEQFGLDVEHESTTD